MGVGKDTDKSEPYKHALPHLCYCAEFDRCVKRYRSVLAHGMYSVQVCDL